MFIFAFVAAAGSPGVPAATEPFREEHRHIRTHLDEVADKVGKLSRATATEQKTLMAEIVSFFEKHIAPHADWEERVLYPAVDTKAGSPSAHPFTASMRYEHRIVHRWVKQLDAERKSSKPDLTRFARQSDRLLGLVLAHFEEEEEILLPILDAKMAPEEFRKLMGAHTP